MNAAFNFRLQNGIVAEARLCFGGISPKFVHASATESLLINRDIFKASDLETIMACLDNELHPNWVLPDASPEYRKMLALALLYRFVLNISPTVRPQNLSGSRPLLRPISSGTQSFETFEKKYPLTKPVEKYEGLLQCSGEAMFVNDMPSIKGELWAAFVVATKVHYKIAEIDTDEAMVRRRWKFRELYLNYLYSYLGYSWSSTFLFG